MEAKERGRGAGLLGSGLAFWSSLAAPMLCAMTWALLSNRFKTQRKPCLKQSRQRDRLYLIRRLHDVIEHALIGIYCVS